MANKGPEVLDLDKLIDKKRIIKLAGKEIDVSRIPSKVSLGLLERYEEIDEDNSDSMDRTFDLIMDIVKPQNPDITKDWIIENTDLIQLMAFIEFVIKPVKDRIGDDPKKIMAALTNQKN